MAENNTANFSGALKKVYSDTVVKLVPENAILQRIINFKKTSEGVGEAYVFAVQTQQDQSFAFAAPNSGAFALPDAIPGQFVQASAKPYQYAAKAEISWELMERAMKGNSKQSFVDSTKTVMESLASTARRKIEIQLLYGNVEKGVVGSVSGSTVTINQADYAAYIWSGMQGMPIDIYVGTSAILRKSTTIVGVGYTTTTGTLTLADATGVTAGDTIWFRGERGNVFDGIHKIATTVGSLFGIDNTNYGELQGNVYPVGGNLTFSKVEDANIMAINKGFVGTATLLVNPLVFRSLVVEQAAKRQYTSSETTLKNGAKALTFVLGGVETNIVASPFIKVGYAYIIGEDDYMRFGPTEFRLGAPGSDRLLIESTSVAGSTLIGYGCQGLVCTSPARTTVLTGITVPAA